MTDDQPACAECGQHPSLRSATTDRRWHGGNRFAFRAWLVLLSASLILALPWVQTKLGWRLAEMDHTELRDPRPRALPMVDPPVRWRDVQAAAQGDPEAITLLREGISEAIPLTQTARNDERTTLRVDMVQNKFYEHGSRAGMRRFYENDDDLMRRMMCISVSNEYTGYGWPYSWYRLFRTRLIDYQEVVFQSSPMGVDPEPISTEGFDDYERWHWTGIVASIAFAWWSGWLAAIILRKLGAARSVYTAARWCVAIGLLTAPLIVGLDPTPQVTKTRFSTAHEKIPSQVDPRARSIDEMRELISKDAGVQQIAHRLTERHNTLDRPNALVGLIAFNPVQSSAYMLRFGYWGESGLNYSRMSYFTLDEDGNATPVAREQSPHNKNRFHISLRGVTINTVAGNPPNTNHLVTIDSAMLLTWLSAMAILLHVLRWCARPFYRRIQRRRLKRGLCIWCKYPVPGNP